MAFRMFILLFIGLLIGRALPENIFHIYYLALIPCLISLSFYVRPKIVSHLMLFLVWFLLSVIFGFLTFQNPFQSNLILSPGAKVSLSGTIISVPKTSFLTTQFLFKADNIHYSDQSFETNDSFLIRIRHNQNELNKHQMLKLSGRVERIKGDNYYTEYLQNKGIRHEIWVFPDTIHAGDIPLWRKWVSVPRKKIILALERTSVRQETVKILSGILLGEKADIPLHVKENYIHMNTFHIFAISGLHFGLISVIVLKSLRLFGINKEESHYWTIPILFIFLGIVDFPPSACRAFIMISLYLLAPCIARKVDSLNVIGVAGLILLFINPWNVIHKGFILSFTAVTILLNPARKTDLLFQKWLNKRMQTYAMDPDVIKTLQFIKRIVSPVIYSCFVWIGTAPLIAKYFLIFSPVSVVSNLIAIVFLPVILFFTLLSGTLGQIWIWFGESFVQVASLALDILTLVFQVLEKIPGSYFETQSPDFTATLTIYLVLTITYLGLTFFIQTNIDFE